MIHVVCNLCRRIIADTDRDAFREGVTDTDRRRADICGACMRDAAGRVLSYVWRRRMDAQEQERATMKWMDAQEQERAAMKWMDAISREHRT